jgi:hypothetical protein
VLLALLLGMSRRPGAMAAAVRLDRALGLKDRIGTAESIRQGRTRGELADLARVQAERLARTIDIRRATPIRIRRSWAAGVALSLLLGAGVAFLPELSRATRAATTSSSPQLAEQRTEIVETISDAVADLDPDTLDPETREDVETLEALAEQLTNESATATELSDARDQSAAQLEEVADRLAEQARRNLDAVDEVTRRFDGIRTPDEATPPTEALADALREGDLEEAAERFDDLMESGEETSTEEREQLARELRELGEQLNAPPEDPEAGRQTEEISRALEDLGLDEETARELLEQVDPEAMQEALEQQDLDPEAMRRLAEDLERLREQEQVREQADEQQRRLGEAFEDAAEQLEPREPEPTEETQEPSEPQPQQPQEPPGAQREQSDPQQQGQTEGQRQQQEEQQGQEQQQQQQPAREQPGEPPGQPQEQPGERTQEVPQAGDGEQQQQQQPQQVPQQVPGQPPQEGPTQEVPVPGEEPPDAGRPPARRPSVSEMLREMERMQREGEGQQQDSERLRQAARDLADSLTDQEKRELAERWMQRPQADPGGTRLGAGQLDEQPPDGAAPFETIEDVDLREEGAEDEGRIIAEWLGPEGGEGEPALPARGRARARAARTEAERAVEKAVVPSRYAKYIRRYFGRLEETVDKAAERTPAEGGDA